MTNKNFSFSEAFGAGWAKLKEHWRFFILAYTIIFAVSGAFGYLSDGPYRDIEPTSGLLGLIGLLLRIWINFNFLVITIRIFDGVKPEVSDLFRWREETLAYVGASLLYGIMVFLGCLAFVIPGLYLAVKYGFYGFLIADKRLGAFDALKSSGQMTSGVKWLLTGFGLTSVGIVILGALAFMIGILIAIPIVSLALVFVYRSLYDQTFDLATATAGTVVTVPAAEISTPGVEAQAPEVMITPVSEKTEASKSDTVN